VATANGTHPAFPNIEKGKEKRRRRGVEERKQRECSTERKK
jgi:hypothetical protein